MRGRRNFCSEDGARLLDTGIARPREEGLHCSCLEPNVSLQRRLCASSPLLLPIGERNIHDAKLLLLRYPSLCIFVDVPDVSLRSSWKGGGLELRSFTKHDFTTASYSLSVARCILDRDEHASRLGQLIDQCLRYGGCCCANVDGIIRATLLVS